MKSKYILICSDENEGSTDIVCDWLHYFNKPFIRISSLHSIKIKNAKIFNGEIDIEFSVKDKTYFLSEIKSYLYRRSHLEFEKNPRIEKSVDDENISWLLNACMEKEYDVLLEYFKKQLYQKAKLNTEIDNGINKLEVLSIANSLGISIPDTLITNEKKALNQYNGAELITKAIGDFSGLQSGNSYGIMTNKISKSDVIFDYFFYTLFQNQVDKLFELRIFFLRNKFYSSAIFSQSNEKTKVDFRNYDFEFPNRVTTFSLPKEIESKLFKLMKILNLQSGSIDMAYTKKGEYVFFEVNPIGQFEQVSFPCYYNLHQKIATLL